MTTLRTRITDDMKQAMKEGDKTRLATLRLVNAALKDKDIEARVAGGDAAVGDADVLAVLQKMIKQREESAATYAANGREELAQKEREEIAIIRDYMPRPLDGAELEAAIRAAVKDSGASGPADMGKVMAVLKTGYPGRIDMSKASAEVKKILAGR